LVFLLIALGGAAGALARYGLAGWVHGLAGGAFPWGTLVVNTVGSFLIGVAVRVLDALAAPIGPRVLLITGFLGGFTTFSAFSYEALTLVQHGHWARAGLYVAASVVLGIAAALAGFALAGVVRP